MLPEIASIGSGKMIAMVGLALANMLTVAATQFVNKPKQNMMYTQPQPQPSSQFPQPVYVNPAPVFQQPQPVVVQQPPSMQSTVIQPSPLQQSRRFQTQPQPIYPQQPMYQRPQQQQMYYQQPQHQTYYDPYSQRCPYGYS